MDFTKAQKNGNGRLLGRPLPFPVFLLGSNRLSLTRSAGHRLHLHRYDPRIRPDMGLKLPDGRRLIENFLANIDSSLASANDREIRAC